MFRPHFCHDHIMYTMSYNVYLTYEFTYVEWLYAKSAELLLCKIAASLW